jgi:hypothetical protein
MKEIDVDKRRWKGDVFEFKKTRRSRPIIKLKC